MPRAKYSRYSIQGPANCLVLGGSQHVGTPLGSKYCFSLCRALHQQGDKRCLEVGEIHNMGNKDTPFVPEHIDLVGVSFILRISIKHKGSYGVKLVD